MDVAAPVDKRTAMASLFVARMMYVALVEDGSEKRQDPYTPVVALLESSAGSTVPVPP